MRLGATFASITSALAIVTHWNMPMAMPRVDAFVTPGRTPHGRCPLDMAALRAGTFIGAEDNLLVSVEPFCMDKYEVTLAQFLDCVRQGVCVAPDKHNSADNYATFCNYQNPDARLDHPVNCIDYSQAVRFCEHRGRRLPNEHEWEWAARGQDAGRTYPWGEADPAPGLLNACGGECIDSAAAKGQVGWKALYLVRDGFAETAPVGSFPRGNTAAGIFDLAGNVREWTSSKVVGDVKQIIRGAGWSTYDAQWFQAGRRDSGDPTVKNSDLGFRCVR